MEGDGLVPAARRISLGQALRRFRPMLRPHRVGIVALLVVAAALPAVEAVEIWLFQRVVDDVLVPRSLAPLIGLAVAYLLLSLTSGLLGWVDQYVSTWVGSGITLEVRRSMLTRIHAAPATLVDGTRAGDLLTRVTTDARSIEALLLSVAVDGVGALARIVLFTGALLVLDWQLALLALVVAPVLWWSARRFGRRLKEASREKRRRAGSMASVAEQSIGALSLVQLHGRERDEQERFDREGRAIVAAELAAARVRAVYPLVLDLVELVAMLAVLALGTWALAGDRLTLGQLLVFLTYLAQLYRPVRTLGDLGVEVVAATAGAERVLEVLDLPLGLAERPDPVPLDPVAGRLQARGVGYAYRPGCPVVTDFHLLVEPGSLVALAGPSGSGKSTVLRLLGRLADPDVGQVLLDGVDLRDLALRTTRDAIGFLLQEAPVLDATVRENLWLARPGADDAALWAALREAGAADVVADLPQGLDAPLGRHGRTLSGGQRQRVALARTLLGGAPVLLLDEPTTGLDGRDAARLVATLRELARTRSVVVASHDPVVLDAADRVVDLADPGQPGPGRERPPGTEPATPASRDTGVAGAGSGVPDDRPPALAGAR
ncbi:MAG: ABC transporter ATP-binding protein/permease [Candidatus Nanopelagicales bacterium]|nr:ABC transporter ATP-binding protein/permease [Candidatus Nanopelagicales bacterium]